MANHSLTSSALGSSRSAAALLVAAATLFMGSASAQTYTYTDLGSGSAYGINDAGQVVGASNGQATLWNGTTPTYLGAGTAYDINNAGQVVGASNGQATVWNGTTPTYLGAGTASGINDAGRVVGENQGQATLWNGTTPTHLGMLTGGTRSYAYAINNAGQVVGGTVAGIGTFNNHATLWNGTTPTELTTLGGESVATSINNAGRAAGFGYLPNNFNSRALLWNSATPTQMDNLAGNSSFAMGVNNAGQIVGRSFTVDPEIGQHATLWNGTVVTDLNTFLDADLRNAGWYLADARAINDSGWITGTARNDLTRESHAYLLTAAPEPATYVLMLAGLLAAGAMARRRAAN